MRLGFGVKESICGLSTAQINNHFTEVLELDMVTGEGFIDILGEDGYSWHMVYIGRENGVVQLEQKESQDSDEEILPISQLIQNYPPEKYTYRYFAKN